MIWGYNHYGAFMNKPTLVEANIFLEKLRAQASFLQDPAIIDAVAFIERMIGANEKQYYNRAISSEMELPPQPTRIKQAA